MRKTLLSTAAVLLCAVLARAGQERGAAVEAPPAAPALSAPSVPALPALDAALSPSGVAAPQVVAAGAEAALAAGAQASAVASAVAPAAPASAVAAVSRTESAVAAPQDGPADDGYRLFDGGGARPALTASVPSVPLSTFERRIARVSRSKPVPVGRLSLSAAPKFSGLTLLEQASRRGAPVVAAAGAALLVVSQGLAGLGIIYLTARLGKAAAASYQAHLVEPGEPVSLSEPEQRALKARIEGRLDVLFYDLSLPEWRKPEVLISNDADVEGMSIEERYHSYRLTGDWGSAALRVGQGYVSRSDTEIDGVLAHELAHLHYRDTEAWVHDAGGKSAEVGLHSYAAAGMALVAAVPVALLRPYLGTFLGWPSAALASNLLALVAVAALVAAGVMAFAPVRLRERRADLFSVWATGGEGLRSRFASFAERWPRWRWRWRTALNMVWSRGFVWAVGTHPSDPARLGYIDRAIKRARGR